MSQALRIVDRAEQAQVLLHPTRLALLEALDQPASPAHLARGLDQPRQRINYHLRELESAGLIEVAEERPRGSVIERTYRRAGQAYAISSSVLGNLQAQPEHLADRLSAEYQIALASRTVRELAALDAGARAAEQKLATFALDTELRFASATERAAFAEELTEAVGQLVRRYHREDAPRGRTFRLQVGCYPRPKDPPECGEDRAGQVE